VDGLVLCHEIVEYGVDGVIVAGVDDVECVDFVGSYFGFDHHEGKFDFVKTWVKIVHLDSCCGVENCGVTFFSLQQFDQIS
jgi:coenzyme F420-reducing hydrogenase delta subunit